MALVFLVVGVKVLDRGDHMLALHAANVGDGKAAGEIGVFAVTLEISSPQRLAIDVDRRPENHVPAQRLHLLRDRLGFTLNESRVPSGRHGNAGGEGGGFNFDRVRGVGYSRAAEPRAYAHGTVRHLDGGNAQAWNGRRLRPARAR